MFVVLKGGLGDHLGAQAAPISSNQPIEMPTLHAIKGSMPHFRMLYQEKEAKVLGLMP